MNVRYFVTLTALFVAILVVHPCHCQVLERQGLSQYDSTLAVSNSGDLAAFKKLLAPIMVRRVPGTRAHDRVRRVSFVCKYKVISPFLLVMAQRDQSLLNQHISLVSEN